MLSQILLVASIVLVVLAKKCPRNSEFGITGEYKCNLSIENGDAHKPKCWCNRNQGYARHPNGTCVYMEDCPEPQHECAHFEVKVMSGPREKTCLTKNSRKPNTTTSKPRCQCKRGTVRQLSTGKCISPRSCPKWDGREYSNKYEEYDLNCLGVKVFYDYGSRNKGFCKKNTVRLLNGNCVNKEQCPK